MKLRFLQSFAVVGSILTLAIVAFAQEPPKPPATPPAPAEKPADPNKPAAAAYAKSFGDWETLLKDLRQLKVQYQSAPEAEHKKMEGEWTALIAKGNSLLGQLEADGLKAYAETPNGDPQLTRFLVKLATDALDRDEYEAAARISQVLIDNESGEKSVYDTASLAAYALGDFDKAAEYHKIAQDAGVVSPTWSEWSADPVEYKKLWEKESEIRAAEEKKKDLPRVKFTTTKGDIVLELFEDQAPDTVGNFVSLVEKGFYNGLSFHRVLKGFMAQGGDPKGDGTGGPGYQIPCECYRENYRRHFRGSLSMAHAGRDTGGSQFFLTFRPTPHLNGLHTCFGRVVEGMEVLAKLQRRDPTAASQPEPDKITKAEVVRKREHEYVPKKTGS
jgi:cyclophilin family peptidyl-prolyl cis-trans isomerase